MSVGTNFDLSIANSVTCDVSFRNRLISLGVIFSILAFPVAHAPVMS
jgi:hypothetical protein